MPIAGGLKDSVQYRVEVFDAAVGKQPEPSVGTDRGIRRPRASVSENRGEGAGSRRLQWRHNRCESVAGPRTAGASPTAGRSPSGRVDELGGDNPAVTLEAIQTVAWAGRQGVGRNQCRRAWCEIDEATEHARAPARRSRWPSWMASSASGWRRSRMPRLMSGDSQACTG